MPHEKLRPSFTFDEDRIAELKKIAPEAFADGKINWETLKEALGEYMEEDGPDSENFGLFWPGKKQARRLASIPSKGTLVPVPGEGVDEDTTRNIFIEGENLEVLKLLQKSYAGRIKMIYIDPPYNTGNDFVYEDDFKEPLQEYLRRTGQLDEEGKPLTTNTRADGRFHSKWLSMIYPRLKLARNLLRDDGLIFVSIDDSEVFNLRAIMNEVFGEENFIDSIIWKKRYGGGAKEKYLVTLHEYILVYSKDINEIVEIFVPLSEQSIKRYYKLKDSNYETRGAYRTHPLEATKSVGKRDNLIFPIIAPDGSEIWPERQWWWDRNRVSETLKNNELEFVKNRNNKWSVHTKQYLRDPDGNIRKTKMFSVIDDIYTQHGTNEIKELFGDSRAFNFPKPSKLIDVLLEASDLQEGDIVADFFAGSGPVAHSVMKFNLNKKKKLSYLLVQFQEQISEFEYARELDYKFISDITKDRIKKVINKIGQESFIEDLDLGFQVLSLANSNYKLWFDNTSNQILDLEKQFGMFETPLVENWNPENLLYEILLIEGFPLDSKIDNQNKFSKNRIKQVTSNFCEHKLLVCLDEKVQAETIENLQLEENDIFICLDSAITDQQKVQLSDKGILKTI